MTSLTSLAVLTVVGVALASACSSDPGVTQPSSPGPSAGAPATTAGAGGGASAGAPAGGSTQAAGGSSAGAAPSAGAGGSVATAGAAGTTGSAGAASAGSGPTPPTGNSMGCGVTPANTDSVSNFVKHDVEVTEPMDQTYLAAHPISAGKTYNWTHRNYFLRLPSNYDKSKPYQLSIGGSGCGGGETVGSEGGYALMGSSQTNEIQVALSYVIAGNACFSDDATNSPDLQYFDAVLADLESKFCIDKSKVFVHGYSSGAWETYLLGCARAGVVRGIFTSQGGERLKRPTCTGPVAALLSAGANASNDNPIGPLDPNSSEAKSLDSLGSAVARDEILMRNGCTGTATKTWSGSDQCVEYTGCPKAYPVIWCAINGGHEYASQLAAPAETLFQSLSAAQ